MKSIKNLKNIKARAEANSICDPKEKPAKIEARILKEWADAEAQPDPSEITITIEWTKSRMWGSKPHAVGRVWDKDGNYKCYEATCSGCGYDKESTVIAEILNHCMRGVLLKAVNKGKEIPYGASVDQNGVWVPSFSGGVGTSCFEDGYSRPGVIQAIGGSMTKVASGNTFDAWEIKYPVRQKKKETT